MNMDTALKLSSPSLSHSLSRLRIGASPVGREAFTLNLKACAMLGHLGCKPSPVVASLAQS